MGERVFIVGLGMTKFEKPGVRSWDYPDMAKEAVSNALKDSKVGFDSIQQVFAGYVYGDSTSGQRAVYEAGLSGVPIFNVHNNCATGASAVFLARQAILSGQASIALALGFEKMERGSLSEKWTDRVSPLGQHLKVVEKKYPECKSPIAIRMFGAAGREHMERFGSTREQFAKVAEKNHRHSVNNPFAQFQKLYTLKEILDSPSLEGPLTKLQCSPTSEGAAAVILASEKEVKARGLEKNAVEILSMAVATDLSSSFKESVIDMVGAKMTEKAAREVYEESGLSPEKIQVIELHDCFSTNEVISYEALGLCPLGKGGELIESGAVTYGGKWVVNPSGGLISKGHPLGATGIAQAIEISLQLRGLSEKRQVTKVEYGLTHNIGLGGAAVVGVYSKFCN